MHLFPFGIQVMSERGCDGDGPVGAVVVVEEGLGGSVGDDAGALIVKQGGRVALKDCDGVGKAFENEASEESTERASNLRGGAGSVWVVGEGGGWSRKG